MLKWFLCLFLILAVEGPAFAWPFKCNVVVSSENQKKILELQELSKKVAGELFNVEDILENPKRFKAFLKALDQTHFGSLHEKQIDTLVETYLAATLKNKNADSFSQTVLQIYASAELTGVMRQKGFQVEKKKFQYSNRLKTATFLAVWSTLAWTFRVYVPVYLPNYKKEVTTAQMESLSRTLPNLTPEQAIAQIQKEIPEGHGWRIYRKIQKVSVATALTMLLFSDPSLHLLNKYTPVGAPLKQAKQQVALTWDKVFVNRAEMEKQVFALRAVNEDVNYDDNVALEELRKSVESMSFEELHEYLN